jgi:phosphatidylserine synthase
MPLRRRSIYLLPNLFTTGVLFAGFFAVVQAMNQRFEIAAIAIYVAMVLDGLDGRVARWTRTQSEFGAQYDSLADMVAFGAAPALVMTNFVAPPSPPSTTPAALVVYRGGVWRSVEDLNTPILSTRPIQIKNKRKRGE